MESGKREPFIHTQQFLLLDDVQTPYDYLEPERFRQGRLLAFDKQAREKRTREGQDPAPFDLNVEFRADVDLWIDAWKPIDRRSLFADRRIRRLCLTIDGGTGKTTTLRWLAAQQHDAALRFGGSKLALLIDLKRATALGVAHHAQHDGKPFGNRRASEAAMQVLVAALRNPIGRGKVEGLDSASDDELIEYLRRLMRSGQLALLIDGLDQTQWSLSVSPESSAVPSRAANPIIEGLAFLLQHDASACPVIIAGRPHAVTRYWKPLFEGQDWRFAQIDGFREDKQKRAFLGDRFSAIQSLEADSLDVPRFLSAVRRLDPTRLRSIQNGSQLYYALIDYVWQHDVEVDRTEADSKPSTLRLLAGLSFTMLQQGKRGGVAEQEFNDFIEQFRTSHGERVGHGSRPQLNAALARLGQTNSLLEYCFLDSDGEVTDLFFRDTTLQEFFAAYWLVTDATVEDQAWMARFPFIRGHKPLGDETLERIWRFAVEMPCGPANESRWLSLVGHLFAPNPRLGRRANEMMFRSWDRLREIAAKPAEGFLGISAATRSAREILDLFHAEFRHEIVGGRRGEQAKETADRLLADFVSIPPTDNGPEDLAFTAGLTEEQRNHPTVTVWANEESRSTRINQRFELLRTPVTCKSYALYESAHEGSSTNKLEDESGNLPVHDVDWYAAKMFSLWLTEPIQDWDQRGPRVVYDLPHELEWEFASRASTDTIWYFCADHEEDATVREIMDQHARTNRNSRRLEPVMTRQPNPWGCYDMLGLVWEWCDNDYAADPRTSLASPRRYHSRTSRVCRGGSWSSVPTYCRSSVRFNKRPAYSNDNLGFRVARAPENL